MHIDDARRAVAEADANDLEHRAERLAELSELLPGGLVGTSGEAADLLFSDVKATWIYGYLAATTVLAASFCIQQLASMLRLRPSDSGLPEATTSLEDVARMAQEAGIVDAELRTKLVALHDAAQIYTSAHLHQLHRGAEQRALEADRFSDDDFLLEDARAALRCAIAVLHR